MTNMLQANKYTSSSTQGENYMIENNTFYTSANTMSLDKIGKIWGFRVIGTGDPLVDLEKDNNFDRFKGIPVKR